MRKKLCITFNAPATLTFVLIGFLVTLWGNHTGGYSTRAFFMTYRTSLTDPMFYLRLFTHVLGHSGWDHFMSNAAYLLLLGPMLEEKYGSKQILEIIALTALVTGIINCVMYANVALCGASGVVFAFILLSSFTNFKQGEIPLTFLLVAAIYIGDQILQGLLVSDNISNMAHIVGGLIGTIIGCSVNRHRR